MFLTEKEINSDAPKMLEEELNRRPSFDVGKCQAQVRELLIQYGCTEQEASIERCRDMGEVVEMLVHKFTEKAEVLRNYEA